MQTKLLSSVLAALALAPSEAALFRSTDPVLCPTDAFKCPDGSFVVRDPKSRPPCRFEPCPTTQILCTADVFICEPGVSVGRDADNNCEFFECPSTSASALIQSKVAADDIPAGPTCSGSGDNLIVDFPLPPLGTVPAPSSSCTVTFKCSDDPQCKATLEDASAVVGIPCTGADMTIRMDGFVGTPEMQEVFGETSIVAGFCYPCFNGQETITPNDAAIACGIPNVMLDYMKYIDPTYWMVQALNAIPGVNLGFSGIWNGVVQGATAAVEWIINPGTWVDIGTALNPANWGW